MKGICIVFLAILGFVSEGIAQDSFAADTVDIEKALYIVVGGDTVAAIGNIESIKEGRFWEPPNHPREIYIYAGAFLLPDSGTTHKGALKDTLFTSGGGTLPIDEYLIFGPESSNYRRAYVSFRVPRGLHDIDSVAVLNFVNDTDEDSIVYNISKLAISHSQTALGGSKMSSLSYGSTQALRFTGLAVADSLQKATLTDFTFTPRAWVEGDMVHILIERVDADSSAEDVDTRVWAIIVYWH
jgi:hypothetical protein